MNKLYLGALTIFACQVLQAQNVGIGTATPNSKAALEIKSTTKGLLIPTMTTSERFAITSPPNGLMVYDTDKNEFHHYDGTAWRAILNNEYWSRPATSRARIANAADSIGIGTSGPTARLHVNGDVKITDGSQGDGKVLTSDANGKAAWKIAAYGSNDRVLVKFSGYDFDSIVTFPSIVYTNGTGITYNTIFKRFTINKSGLYRFNGAIAQPGLIFAEHAAYVTAFIEFDDNLLYLGSNHIEEDPTLPGAVIGRIPFSFTADFYLTAGTTVYIKIKGFPISSGSSSLRNNYISAYLIND